MNTQTHTQEEEERKKVEEEEKKKKDNTSKQKEGSLLTRDEADLEVSLVLRDGLSHRDPAVLVSLSQGEDEDGDG